jgi:hypothetical protein
VNDPHWSALPTPAGFLLCRQRFILRGVLDPPSANRSGVTPRAPARLTGRKTGQATQFRYAGLPIRCKTESSSPWVSGGVNRQPTR